MKSLVFLGVNASYSHSSLAAWRLQSVTDPQDWRWLTVEATPKDDPVKVVERVLEAAPDVVAATLYLFNRDYVMVVLRAVRAARPQCRIVVGGPECLGDTRGLRQPAGVADATLRGEGELAFPALLNRWREGKAWDDIPGLGDGTVAEAISDLDALPPLYASRLAGFDKPFIQLETSRGCSNGCLFCTSRKTPHRIHSLDRVRGDLTAIAAAGIREVRVLDRTFNEDSERAAALIRLFRDEFPGTRFHLEIDPARFGGALAGEFARAEPGRFHLEAGIQSLNPQVYGKIEREATVPRTLAGLTRLCGMKNLEIHVDLIAGLPGGTWADVVADVRVLMVLEPAEIQLERLKLLPGTPLAQDPARWELEASSVPPYAVTRTGGMSAGELDRADRLSRVIDRFYNVPALRPVMAEAVRLDPEFLEAIESAEGLGLDTDGCQNLEDRFLALDRRLAARPERFGTLLHRLRYTWFRLGFSARLGPIPATAWKAPIPATAELVEGDGAAPVARVWRVDLEAPYLFCYGTDPRGARTVVAVYRL